METVEKGFTCLQHTKKTFGKPMEKRLLFRKLSTVFFALVQNGQRMKKLSTVFFALVQNGQRMKIPFRS